MTSAASTSSASANDLSRCSDLVRYHLSSNEADASQELFILKDEHDRRLFTKTRKLTETEIVDTVFNSSHEPAWTIHRPRRGWYLVIRPLKPEQLGQKAAEDSFVQLLAVKGKRGKEGELQFELEVGSKIGEEIDLRPAEESGAEGGTSVSVAMDLNDPSDLDKSSGTPSTPAATATQATVSTNAEEGPSTRTVKFTLQPRLPHHSQRVTSQTTSRWTPGHILRRVVAGKENDWSCVVDPDGDEIMRFEEEITLSSSSTKGLILVDRERTKTLDINPDCLVTIALAYLEHLQDLEAYQAAGSGD
ncbi:BZ3500_MvSof-1268-A1-R1_Chr12-2g03867 [Microbotryum saponariae]|uniref:BZ3500_MvSof-1268-A1-R1_Chr12-2g03867 protein n=1 Tax=Microbotryum saponariae TaxID=289078 RepID=A0A2X0MJH5_9BASI|nr:BZ3500_MvSof-1268-A1-R1_Chr12-2g03867 [Microbotryum saponariae]SCZ99818.1 BZ3501_MvSof-1269-A2-R1_Chr12-2g03513 [Microbotryum saponariae]